MKKIKILYSKVGDNYKIKDPFKRKALETAFLTGKNLKKKGFQEIELSRGGSAYIWQQGKIFMTAVIEGLGTKNLVADEMEKITGKSYYNIVAHDTVAAIINDLITTGATPLTIHAYWAFGDESFLKNKEKLEDLILGWKNACDLADVSWGGGETPTLKGIINPETVDLAGSAVGIIKSKKRLINENNLKAGDIIILLKSNGINANGVSLARAIAKKLPQGYKTILKNGKMYGEELLKKTNIYAKLIEKLFKNNIDIHYITNITGHGFKKIMRARKPFTYIIKKIYPSDEIFLFIQKIANLSDYQMYQIFNMGMDYAIFLSKKQSFIAQKIISSLGFKNIIAGYVKEGKKQVIIEPKKIIYRGDLFY